MDDDASVRRTGRSDISHLPDESRRLSAFAHAAVSGVTALPSASLLSKTAVPQRFFCYLNGVQASDFFALPPSLARFAPFFPAGAAPWEWLKQIGPALAGADLRASEVQIPPGIRVEGSVWLHPTVKLPAYATLIGPAWIGAKTELRPGAFIRGNVIVGEGCATPVNSRTAS
jgi:hypothetical protein